MTAGRDAPQQAAVEDGRGKGPLNEAWRRGGPSELVRQLDGLEARGWGLDHIIGLSWVPSRRLALWKARSDERQAWLFERFAEGDLTLVVIDPAGLTTSKAKSISGDALKAIAEVDINKSTIVIGGRKLCVIEVVVGPEATPSPRGRQWERDRILAMLRKMEGEGADLSGHRMQLLDHLERQLGYQKGQLSLRTFERALAKLKAS